ncbi:hypothetical protein ABB37_05969 [Leptomonas pyrrhocoris]|uniref:SPRY domain-containing protein n=1 Tax=Leptomonas pyrrhocoris TaxID=157538 RepID=A0A0M9FYV6_LEPPY|nr:hypothetical protein ABB37_05969 [Leptomonas pyrrhocoris]KPA78905.1 hypothetical protein ABB37_05969 [Leptomonas pyrrhocoris]|eukprot:XP_015657344.1 hypothetical protein ABB37_05969 [Leptomonas pyrrhocoris]
MIGKSSLSPEPGSRRSPQATPPLSPRQRTTSAGVAARTARSPQPSSSSPTSVGLVVGAVAAAKEKSKERDAKAPAANPEESREPSPAPLATPRAASTASRMEEIRARLAASRQQSASRQATPRSSLGSAATAGAANAVKDDSASRTALAEAAATIKELKQAVKDKDRELALLTRGKSNAEQQLEKAKTKSEDLQAKMKAEEAVFAAFKKEAAAAKLKAQKELRQAQSTARMAQAAQERVQKELEKQKGKLAAAAAAAAAASSSHTTSATPTPAATPRGLPLSVNSSLVADAGEAALQLKLTRVEKENAALKKSVEVLKRDAAAATATAVEAAVQKTEQQQSAMQKASREEMDKLKSDVTRLAKTLAERSAALKSTEEEVKKLKAEVEQVRKEKEEVTLQSQKRQQQQERAERQQVGQQTDALALPDNSASASTTPLRSPRQVVTFELSAKEATAQLQDELTATQRQVEAYKRMQAHADHRIAQLEAELTSMQSRAKDAVEALQRRMKETSEKDASAASDATALDAVKRDLEKVRNDYNALKKEAQESGEESLVLQSALEEAEDERDVYERQLRDLQQEHSKSKWEATAAIEKLKAKMSAELKEARGLLDVARNELRSAQEISQCKEVVMRELQAQVEGLRKRCAEMEERQVSAETEAPSETAAEALTKQVGHYKKKSRVLAKRLAEAEKELQVLGEEYTRVCGERDAAVLRYRTGELNRPAQTTEPRQQQQQHSEKAKANLSLHSDGVPPDSVSRDLSDALLSANRTAPTRPRADDPGTTTETAMSSVTAALAQEQRAREHLAKEVSALHSIVAAMEHRTSPTRHPLSTDLSDSVPFAEDDGLVLLPPPSQQLQQRCSSISDAPARARSPRTTHALDLRFFDPTSVDVSVPAAVQGGDRAAGQGRAVSQPAVAASLSPRRLHTLGTLSPQRARRSASAGTRESALDAIYSETPLPPVYLSAPEDGSDVAAASSTSSTAHRPDLLFSTTAGALLVSKRGRQLHRPLVAARSLPRGGGGGGVRGDVNSEDGTNGACCAALASMSHAIYASRMNAEGLFHLKDDYRFVLRILTDCEAGEILVGFADRHVPLESFGAKRNALRYRGCYYLSLNGGGLYAPSQGVHGKTCAGWSKAAVTAAERRWQHRRGVLPRPSEFGGGGAAGSSMSPPSSPSRKLGAAPPACVARAGDEIACVLHLNARSISFEWNGVDCGVAFTDVSLSPSLYPCVEVNVSGGTVELL